MGMVFEWIYWRDDMRGYGSLSLARRRGLAHGVSSSFL